MRRKINLIAFLTFLVFALPIISAQFQWTDFGNDLTKLTNAQYPSAHGRFDVPFYYSNSSFGQDTPLTYFALQPIVTEIYFPERKTYIVLQIGNYIQYYDTNWNLQYEVYTGGNLISNLDALQFSDSQTRDVFGVYKINDSLVSLKGFHYNSTLDNVVQIYESNFTKNNSFDTIAGLRHNSQNIYFGYDTPFKLIKTNLTGTSIITTANLDNNTYPIGYQDMDSDSILEFLTFDWQNLNLFKDNTGAIVYSYDVPYSIYSRYLADAKIIKPDSSSQYKIAMIEGLKASVGSNLIVTLKKLDGSTYWTKSFSDLGYNYDSALAIGDYNGDGLEDLFIAYTDTSSVVFKILKGSDGSTLFNRIFPISSYSNRYNYLLNKITLTIADMNYNGRYDFIFNSGKQFIVFDSSSNTTLLDTTLSNTIVQTAYMSCVPADSNLDGFLEIVCSGKDFSTILSSSAVNSNPTISSITLLPSSVLAINQTLTAVVNAIDSETDVIFYSRKCFDGDSWSNDSVSNSLTCSYGIQGLYTLSIGVKDSFHSTYTTYNASISVTETGAICNGNAICESGLGETISNCPSDCPASTQETTSTEGGMVIPTKLVDTANTERGFLPEIYYGILGFLSNVLSPMIILVFAIFFVLIMIALATIIKMVGKKVGDLAR